MATPKGSGRPDSPARLSILRRAFRLLRPHKARMALAILSTLVAGGLGVLLPRLVVLFLEVIAASHDSRLLSILAAGSLVMFVGLTAAAALSSYLLALVGERLVLQLRTDLHSHLHDLSLDFFQEQRVGDLISRLSSDIEQVRSAATTGVARITHLACTLIGVVAVMFSMNARVTILVLCLTPIELAIIRVFSRKLEDESARLQDTLSSSTVIAEEGLRIIYLIKSFGRVEQQKRRYAKAMGATFAASVRIARIRALFFGVSSLCSLCTVVAVIWFGGLEVMASRLTLAEISGFLIYAIMTASSLAELGKEVSQLSAARGGVRRVFELLELRPSVSDSPNAVRLPSCAGRVTFEGVTFGYTGGPPVITNLSLDVKRGELFALVGRSGAGKSTVLNLIARLFDPSSGRVLVDGVDIRGITQESLREQLALVHQDTMLFGGTVRENLQFAKPDASDAEMMAAAREANAHEFIMELPDGYDTVVGERGVRLSGGQRQRLAIARAILKDPPILLLDEATSSLDGESEELVREAVRRLMRQRSRTTIVVAHRLSTVRTAHRIGVLEAGRIRELGTHDELLRTESLYARMCAIQADGLN